MSPISSDFIFEYRADPDGINVVVIVDDDGNIAVPLINGKASNVSSGTVVLPAAFESCATLQNNLSEASWQSPIDYSGEWPTADLAFRQYDCVEGEMAGIEVSSGGYHTAEEVIIESGSSSFRLF